LKVFRFFYRVLKGIYDILATYLLVLLVPYIALSWLLHLGFGFLASQWGFETSQMMWWRASSTLGVEDWIVRAAVAIPIHVAVWYLISRPFGAVLGGLEWIFDRFHAGFQRVAKTFPSIRNPVEIGFTVGVTLLLIPFIIQPTLVPGWSPSSWGQRAANLADGTAVHALQDSVIGLYRQLYAKPVVAKVGVTSKDLDHSMDVIEHPEIELPVVQDGNDPMMDRWNDQIMKSVRGDLDRFATVKAFMWVESAGRQYAVSHTGCAGLMQFCGPTARSAPFRDVFGPGQVYTCSCQKRDCRIPRDVQRDLESGIRERIEKHSQSFPCHLTDARFNPAKIIEAGAIYVDKLHTQLGGNLYLMYIGYNSGPKVAQRAFDALGRRGDASLEEIAAVLPEAMRPTYGPGSDARARSLVNTHLPKLMKAKMRYIPVIEAPKELPAGTLEKNPPPVIEELPVHAP
jgi:hypothetical protein